MLLFKFLDLQRIENRLSRTANHSILEFGNSEEVWRFSFIFGSPEVDKSFLPPYPLSAARVLLPSTYGMRRRKRRSATGIGCLAVMATEKEKRMRKGFSISRKSIDIIFIYNIIYEKYDRIDDTISLRSPHPFTTFLGRMQKVYVFFQELRQLAENGGALEWEAPVLELVSSHLAGATWGLQTCVRIDKRRYVSIYPWVHPTCN